MAVQTRTLDAAKVKLDFPILGKPVHGKPLVYLDSANSALKPRAVIDRISEVYESGYANVHRGVYHLGVVATDAYEGARDKVAAFLNAPSRREVIFTRQATEALNLVAYAYGRAHVGPGDHIVTTELEHHSNLVPWWYLAQATGASIHYLRITDQGELDPESLEQLSALERVKVVAVGEVSNALGTLNDVTGLAAWTHERGGVLVVDGAQAAPHRPVDVQALGCDFYAISGHKMCGPGAGALWGRAELLERMEPFLTGGEMISSVSLERTTWNEIPWKFEAHEQLLTRYGHDLLRSIPGVTVFGPPPERRAGILTFNVGDIHPHDVAQVLDADAICVRAGHHCAQPVADRYGVAATTRASVYLYNTTADLDRLGEGIERVKRTFGV
jgi:cysteine desulfurase/selenocysteine lyase